MKKYFLSYATSYNRFGALRDNHVKSFLCHKNFDYYYILDERSIKEDYKDRHKEIFNSSRGAGYWLWKPYLIDRLLDKIEFGDIIMYCDGLISQKESLEPIFNFIKDKDILPFFINCGKKGTEKLACKRDTLILMNCDNENIFNKEYSDQYGASYLFIRKTEKSTKLIKQWLFFCEDERAISDNPNVLGLPNYPEFIDHRHDQSILSLLCKKYDIVPIYDITQCGNSYRVEDWGQLLVHHGRQ